MRTTPRVLGRGRRCSWEGLGTRRAPGREIPRRGRAVFCLAPDQTIATLSHTAITLPVRIDSKAARLQLRCHPAILSGDLPAGPLPWMALIKPVDAHRPALRAGGPVVHTSVLPSRAANLDAAGDRPGGNVGPHQIFLADAPRKSFGHAPIDKNRKFVAAAKRHLNVRRVHRQVFDPTETCLPPAKYVAVGINLDGLLPGEVAHQIKEVADHVDQRPAVHRLAMHRQLRANLANVSGAEKNRSAKLPALEQLAVFRIPAETPVLEGDLTIGRCFLWSRGSWRQPAPA